MVLFPFPRRSPRARSLIGGRLRLGLLAGFVVGMLGCREQVLAPSGAVLLETNASMYVALRTPDLGPGNQFSMEMVVAVTNGTTGPVSLQGCVDNAQGTPRFALSMAATRNDWAPAYEDVTGCLAPTTITLAVGESRVDRIVLAAPRLFDGVTGAPFGTLEGRMRLAYFVDGLPLWSNAFSVEIEDPTT